MNDMSHPDRALPPQQPIPMPAPAPAQVKPNQPMTATLEAQEWNMVLGVLNEIAMPMRVIRPVFDKLVEQLNQLHRA